MIKLQLIPLLPFIAALLALLCNKFLKPENVSDKISHFLAILFLGFSFGLKNLHNSTIFTLLKLPNDFSFALIFNADKTLLLLTLGIFWLFASIYCNRYFCLIEDKKRHQFNVLLPTIIGFLSGIILSKNLLTALVFYQFLVLTIYFTADYFSSKSNIKSVGYFGYFILGSSFVLFVALVITFKITGEINFAKDGIFGESAITISEFGLLLFLFIVGIAAIAFVPFYLLFKNLYSLKIPAIIAVLISFGFAAAIFLFKIIAYIFGTKLFAVFMPQINQNHLLTIIIALNLLVASGLAIFSKNLKQILIMLFFNQLIVLIMGFLVFGFNAKKMQIMIASFVFCQLLIFIVIGNISLYLKEAKEKNQDQNLNGIFYKLRLTILALIFALLNLSGLIPAIGAVEKYWLFREVFYDKNLLNGVALIGNIALSLAIAIKIIYPMLEILKKSNGDSSQEIAKNIEGDLILISPILILPLILFLLTFFSLS